MDGITSLRDGIHHELDQISERLSTIRETIGTNVKSDENPTGLFLGVHQEYLKTIEFNLEPLKELVEVDVAHWTANLETARQDAIRIEREI